MLGVILQWTSITFSAAETGISTGLMGHLASPIQKSNFTFESFSVCQWPVIGFAFVNCEFVNLTDRFAASVAK